MDLAPSEIVFFLNLPFIRHFHDSFAILLHFPSIFPVFTVFELNSPVEFPELPLPDAMLVPVEVAFVVPIDVDVC